MSGSGEQQLLYSLRSPTTPLGDKLALAASSLSNPTSSTSTSQLPQLIRDWILDTLFKLVRSSSNTTEQALLSAQLWELLASTTDSTLTSSTSTPTLPVFVAFIQAYTQDGARDQELLGNATRVWSRLAGNAMRKSTVDAVLDGYEKVVKATLKVVSEEEATAESKRVWEEFALIWVKALKVVLVEAAKGGKKVRRCHSLSLSGMTHSSVFSIHRSPRILFRFSLLSFLYSTNSRPLLLFVLPSSKLYNYHCSISTTFEEVSHEILTLPEVLRPLNLPRQPQLLILNCSPPFLLYRHNFTHRSIPPYQLLPISTSLHSRPIPPSFSLYQRKRLSLLPRHRRVLSKC